MSGHVCVFSEVFYHCTSSLVIYSRTEEYERHHTRCYRRWSLLEWTLDWAMFPRYCCLRPTFRSMSQVDISTLDYCCCRRHTMFHWDRWNYRMDCLVVEDLNLQDHPQRQRYQWMKREYIWPLDYCLNQSRKCCCSRRCEGLAFVREDWTTYSKLRCYRWSNSQRLAEFGSYCCQQWWSRRTDRRQHPSVHSVHWIHCRLFHYQPQLHRSSSWEEISECENCLDRKHTARHCCPRRCSPGSRAIGGQTRECRSGSPRHWCQFDST